MSAGHRLPSTKTELLKFSVLTVTATLAELAV